MAGFAIKLSEMERNVEFRFLEAGEHYSKPRQNHSSNGRRIDQETKGDDNTNLSSSDGISAPSAPKQP